MSLNGIATTPGVFLSTNLKGMMRPKPVDIDLKITNNTGKDLYIRQYLSKLNYVKEVQFNGTILEPINSGMCKKMKAPDIGDYELLKDSQSKSYKVPVYGNSNHTYYYDLTQKGSYLITL